MHSPLKKLSFILIPSLFFIFSSAWANINAIDLNKVNYPAILQEKIDFLVKNQDFYNRWMHDWNAPIPKTTVVETLTSLYTGINKISNKNIETYLLLGDISHYLYNMEIEEYYQKAVDNYKQAAALAPADYRTYWFLANHYALSNEQIQSIQVYLHALKLLPSPSAHPLFWADYAVACMNAAMYGTAAYAARESSKIEGVTSYIENEITPVIKRTLRTPPADTTIAINDMWGIAGKQNDKIIFTNFLLGSRLSVDSTWNVNFGGYGNRVGYVSLTPHKAKTKKGAEVSYTILFLAETPKANESLQQFSDKFNARYKVKQPIHLDAENFKDAIATEIYESSMYTDMGGGHLYTIAIERPQPEFPGMLLEAPAEAPKGNSKAATYYKVNRKYSRLSGPMYYFVSLDSCEAINPESLAVFKDFLKNGLLIE